MRFAAALRHATSTMESHVSMASERPEPAQILSGLYGDGIIGSKGAFDPALAARIGEDIDVLLREALARPGGAVARGPERYYVEVHPERIRGFVEIVTHPWFVSVCEAVLGPRYEIIEVGFDVPGPGAQDQPWHRDFPATAEQLERRRLDSLAFNLTAVDVTEDMGPFEIAPGTQWDDPAEFEQGMFPPKSAWGRYEARAQRKMPKAGDISARTALTIHRGTANRSRRARPVLVIGVDAPGAGHSAWHDLQITHTFAETLPRSLLAHLSARRVRALEPIVQAHTIDGLVKPV
jgi:hypothetical protein